MAFKVHGIFASIDQTPVHNSRLNKLQRIETIQDILFDHRRKTVVENQNQKGNQKTHQCLEVKQHTYI